jgi:hypothetical protein
VDTPQPTICCIAAGILPWDDDGGPEGALIETGDDSGGALDAAKTAKLMDEIIVG